MDVTGKDAFAHVKFLPIMVDGYLRKVEPFFTREPEFHGKPVRQVDQILVLYNAACHLRLEAVVAAGEICARIVDVVCARTLEGPPGGEVAVTQGAEGFPQPFFFRNEGFVDKSP